jgi:hypothetical protein
MTTSPEVEAWLASTKPATSETIRRVRDVILAADSRITEYVKYRTLTFAYRGDLAAFVGLARKPVTLMFNRGARINGDFPHLEGEGPTARFMRFADVDEVEERSDELSRIVVAWCDLLERAEA